MIGRTVSHYQILEKLGKGGMGEIYKALDPRLNRFVAIKVLAAGTSADPARRRRFILEAQAASGLNHPNIITIYDVVLEQDNEFMLMEFVAGKTLQELIPKGGLRIPQVLGYGVQTADALSAAHAAGIIHRDLKPGNVMITDAGLVKVLDFGLAKLDSSAGGLAGDDTETVAAEALTVEGSILGTVSYMSPEQAQGRCVDARSDIFSFGVLLYEMVTGILPFSGDSPISTLSSILRDEARPVAELARDVPNPLQEVIARCLRKEPGDRWQTMQEVRMALAALKQDSDAGRLHRQQLSARPVRRLSATVALVVGGMLAAGAVGVWWFQRHAASPGAGARQAATEPGRSADRSHALQGHPARTTGERPEAAEQPERPERTERPDAGPRTLTPELPASPSVRPGLPAPFSIAIPDGSPLSVTLADDIPDDTPVGTPIRFTVSKDVQVGGAVAIPRGASVKGEIVQEGKKKFLVLGAKMMMRLTTVDAADHHTLNVRATPTRRADGRLWRAVDLGGGKRSKGMAAVAGTQYIAYVDGDQSVTVQK
jgi:serine/threonine-protein kinase